MGRGESVFGAGEVAWKRAKVPNPDLQCNRTSGLITLCQSQILGRRSARSSSPIPMSIMCAKSIVPTRWRRRPQPADYCFGGFVSIHLDEGGQLIGLIYNTLLLNPDFGNLGPRLSTQADLAIFSPDYLAETATLVGILALGWMDAQGEYHQGVPTLAATVNNPVCCLEEEPLRLFHQDKAGRLALRYVPLLLAQNNALAMPLMINVVDRLAGLVPRSAQSTDADA